MSVRERERESKKVKVKQSVDTASSAKMHSSVCEHSIIVSK